MTMRDLWIFFKYFGYGVLFSFIATVITFFVLAYTKIMDITVMLLLGIVWFFVGILPSFLTALWLTISRVKFTNYIQLFIIQFILAVGFVLGFVAWTGELKGAYIKELSWFSLVIVGMGVVSGLVAMASGFLTFIKPRT